MGRGQLSETRICSHRLTPAPNSSPPRAGQAKFGNSDFLNLNYAQGFSLKEKNRIESLILRAGGNIVFCQRREKPFQFLFA